MKFVIKIADLPHRKPALRAEIRDESNSQSFQHIAVENQGGHLDVLLMAVKQVIEQRIAQTQPSEKSA